MSIFEVMGPIMIGPSSSHTAGPAKIGRIVRLIFDDEINEIDVYFHGSFAETYRGHGTDRAVIGGILGYKPDDIRIKKALDIANKMGIKIRIEKINLKNAHPNTMIVNVRNPNKQLSLKSISIGAGNIVVQEIDNYQVDITATYPTFWIVHKDRSGIIANITSIIAEFKLNIAFMKVFRKKRGEFASSILEMDQQIEGEIIEKIEEVKDIKQIRYIPSL